MPSDSGTPDTTNSPASTDDLRPAYRRAYEASLRMAKKILGQRFRLVRLARNAYRKTLDEEDAMRAVKEDLFALVRLIRAWANGEYRQVSSKTILSVIGAVLYFVSPLDAIPDFIPVVGLADDVAVIAAVVRSIRGDLDRFRGWENDREEKQLSLSQKPSGTNHSSRNATGVDGPPLSSSS